MGKIIEGVYLHSLKRIEIPDGDVLHALKAVDEGYYGFGEAYFSQVKQGAIKGWKRHNRMTLNIIVPVGCIKFIIYDDRNESDTLGQFIEIILSSQTNYQRLTVNPGLWMAFMGVGEGFSMLLDIIPESHDPLEADRKELSEIKYNF